MYVNRKLLITGPKDANEALQLGYDLKDIFNQAFQPPHSQIVTFQDLKQESKSILLFIFRISFFFFVCEYLLNTKQDKWKKKHLDTKNDLFYC